MAKVEDYTAWKVMRWVHNRLNEINPANGYNTQPVVTMDYDEWKATDARCAILVECTSHQHSSVGIGGTNPGDNAGVPRFEMTLELELTCNVKLRDGEPPRKAAFALEQDVRKCLHTQAGAMTAALGRSFVFRFGGCSHDAGVLTPEREAGFRLEVTYQYPQGSGW